jgi:tellurite resistance protein TerC
MRLEMAGFQGICRLKKSAENCESGRDPDSWPARNSWERLLNLTFPLGLTVLAWSGDPVHCGAASTMFAEYLPQIREAVPVIVSLIIIEGLLSVDNMLAIAALASQLPETQKKTALRMGLAGAYIFRLIALFFVGFIMANAWVKFLGAFYLIHLMAGHFSNFAKEHDDDPETIADKPRSFWPTVFAIQLMDLSLSVDNVVTAVAMSPKIWVVCTGVCLGLLTLWMFATISLKLVEKYPILQHTAFLLIGYVGIILLVEMTADYAYHVHLHIGPERKFIGIVLITGLSIWYARSEVMAKAVRPLLKTASIPMILYAKVSTTLIGAILWPFKTVWGLIRKPA